MSPSSAALSPWASPPSTRSQSGEVLCREEPTDWEARQLSAWGWREGGAGQVRGRMWWSGLGDHVHACMHACARACMRALWMRACLQAWLGRRLQKPRVHPWAKQATVGPAENATD